MKIESTKPFDSIIKDLKEEIPKNMKDQNIPGLTIAVVSKDEVIWIEGFGYTDMSKKQKVDTETLFCLQSTTKSVTAVAFLLAVQQGLVSLDDPLVKYYPEFTVNSRYGEDQYKKITFRHLLSHRSGLTTETKLGGCFDSTPCTWEEHIQSISGSWLKFPVGTRSSYSNAGMDLVAYALEQITNQHYPEYVQKALGDPLGITFYFDRDKVYTRINAARGHLGNFQAAFTDNLGLGCGVAYLSMKDLATFTKFLLNLGTLNGKQILDVEYVNAMRSVNSSEDYGLGTFVYRDLGTSLPNHAGGGFGFCCEMYWLLDHNIGVTGFVNQEYQGYLNELVRKTLKRILEVKEVSTKSTEFPYSDSPTKEIDIRLLNRLEGRYAGITSKSGFLVKVKDGKLIFFDGQDKEMTAHNELAFSAKTVKGILFQLNDQDEPLSLKWYSNSMGIVENTYIGRKKTQPGPNREEWRKYEGTYRFNFYQTESYYDVVKLEDDGYLHFGKQQIYEHENRSNVFFTLAGEAIVFEEGFLYDGNIKGKKIDDPVTDLTELAKKEPKHRYLQGWMLDQVVSHLKYLGRIDETEKILELKQRKS